MTIGFALMLNNETHNFIRQMQLELHQKLGIRLARQTPHITIKSPFETTQIGPYIDYLEHLVEQIKPIAIEFDGFGTFGENVLFLNVKDNQELQNLHWKILEALNEKFDLTPHAFEGENVRFHASIAGFSDRETFLKAQNYLSSYTSKFKFTADELGLFYYLGEGQGWIVNRRLRITGK